MSRVMVYCRRCNCHIYMDRLPPKCHCRFNNSENCYECGEIIEEVYSIEEKLNMIHDVIY